VKQAGASRAAPENTASGFRKTGTAGPRAGRPVKEASKAQEDAFQYAADAAEDVFNIPRENG
jgi:hypothetical protein